jgi:hypothetical protein
MGAVMGGGPAHADQADVAFAEDVIGRVVAFSQGKPILVETLDTINDWTQLDILANSELRICHYQTAPASHIKRPSPSFHFARSCGR